MGTEVGPQLANTGLNRPEPVLASAILVISVHAALLSVPVRMAAPTAAMQAPSKSRADSVQLVAHLAAKGSNEAIASTAAAGHEPVVQQHKGPAKNEMRQSFAESTAVSPPIRSLSLQLPNVLADDDFYPRTALDVGPYPMGSIVIDYPPFKSDRKSYASVLWLFIDEGGKVVRTKIDGPSLPAPLEQAARDAFMGATFSPGHVDGLPVRSRIRVEVVFDEGSQAAK